MTTQNIWPTELAALSIDGKLTDEVRASQDFVNASDIPSDIDIVAQYEYDEDFGMADVDVFVRGYDSRWLRSEGDDGLGDRPYDAAAVATIMFRDRKEGMVWLRSEFSVPSPSADIVAAPRGTVAVAEGLNRKVVLLSLGGSWYDVEIGIDSEMTTEVLLRAYPDKLRLLWVAPGEPMLPAPTRHYELHDEVILFGVPGYIGLVQGSTLTFVDASSATVSPIKTDWSELTLVNRPARPLTADAARARHLAYPEIVCSHCGDHGARMLEPRFYLCSTHIVEWQAEITRHRERTARLRQVKFAQDHPAG